METCLHQSSQERRKEARTLRTETRSRTSSGVAQRESLSNPTIIRETGSELQLLSALEYDAITLGNHDFEFRPDGLAKPNRGEPHVGPRVLDFIGGIHGGGQVVVLPYLACTH